MSHCVICGTPIQSHYSTDKCLKCANPNLFNNTPKIPKSYVMLDGHRLVILHDGIEYMYEYLPLHEKVNAVELFVKNIPESFELCVAVPDTTSKDFADFLERSGVSFTRIPVVKS